MSDPTKRKPDANATIQISLDQVQLFDPNAVPPPSPSEAAMRKEPPPLPTPPPLAAVAEAPAPNAAKTIAYVAMIVVLVGLAILGGLLVGTRARGPAPLASSAAAPPAATPAPEPSASAAPKTLTLPTIEMR